MLVFRRVSNHNQSSSPPHSPSFPPFFPSPCVCPPSPRFPFPRLLPSLPRAFVCPLPPFLAFPLCCPLLPPLPLPPLARLDRLRLVVLPPALPRALGRDGRLAAAAPRLDAPHLELALVLLGDLGQRVQQPLLHRRAL